MTKTNAEDFLAFSLDRGDPDPLILLDLTPFIPDALLPRAIQVALGIPYPDLELRAATVESLAVRFTEEDEALMEETLTAGRLVLLDNGEVEPVLLSTLAPLLPARLIPEALELAISIVKYNIRTDILGSLVNRLPASDQESIMSSALDAIGSLEFKYEKEEAIIILIDHLPPSIPLLEKVVSMAGTLPDEKLKVNVLTALIYAFQNKEEVSDYIRTIRESNFQISPIAEPKEVEPVSRMHKNPAPKPENRVQEDMRVLESMLKLPEFSMNIEYLVRLAQRLPEKERSALIPKMLMTAGYIGSDNTRTRTLITLLPLLSPEIRQNLTDEILNLISSVEKPGDRAKLSSQLAPFLPESMREKMLPGIISMTRTFPDEVRKLMILEDLIPILPSALMHDVTEIIDSFRDPRYSVKALIKMAVFFPGSLLYRHMEKALEAIATADVRERSCLLELFAPCLPSDLLLKAMVMSRGIGERYYRAKPLTATLAGFARQARGQEREDMLREAFKEAFFISPPRGGRGGRSDPMGINFSGKKAKDLLRKLPEVQRETLLREWLGTVRKIPEAISEEVKERLPGTHEGGHTKKMTGGSMEEYFPDSEPEDFNPRELVIDSTESGGTDLEELQISMEEITGSKDIPEKLQPSGDRVVNTGFSEQERPDLHLKDTSLKCGAEYYFWLDIGELVSYSIEKTPTAIPVEHLPAEALLTIALFSFEDEIEITRGADVGELKLLPDGSAIVHKQPMQAFEMLPPELAGKRLFFPVKAPTTCGISKLRCNIYYKQILVQARLIRAMVTEQPAPAEDALVSVVDYTLSYSLKPEHLNRLEPHRLSLMLNSNGDKTHALIFGQNGDTLYKEMAVLSAAELKTPVANARRALRKVSWNDPDPWSGQPYKYKDGKLDIDRLKNDLCNLAISGYILYDALIDKLTGGRKQSYDLADLMLSPGMVQIALKQSPSQVLPAALFYDYPLDTQASQLNLCDAFISSLQNSEPLEKSPCFNGACPSHDKLDTVCPGGFWGFRHFLGTPVSPGDQNDGRDIAPEITVDGKTEFIAGVATNLDRLEEHMKRLKSSSGNLDWHYSESRAEIIRLLKNIKSHVIYFYCHGEYGSNNTLFLQVGNGNEYIEGSILRANRIFWDKPSPLVFINGCHTTAVDPEQAINLVQDFVGSGGAGVIGTEITIFESLACGFAEEFLPLFLSGQLSIGEAIRNTRLKLLKEGNPLGLVYIPFVIPSLRLRDKVG